MEKKKATARGLGVKTSQKTSEQTPRTPQCRAENPDGRTEKEKKAANRSKEKKKAEGKRGQGIR